MFDTIVHKKDSVPYAKNVTINEHRAPTDESIKIYSEMVEKSRKSIVDKIVINDNSFNIKAMVYENYYDYTFHCHYKFSLNKEQFEGEFIIDEYDLLARDEIMRLIYEKASHQITVKLIGLFKLDKVTGNIITE